MDLSLPIKVRHRASRLLFLTPHIKHKYNQESNGQDIKNHNISSLTTTCFVRSTCYDQWLRIYWSCLLCILFNFLKMMRHSRLFAFLMIVTCLVLFIRGLSLIFQAIPFHNSSLVEASISLSESLCSPCWASSNAFEAN